MQKIAVIKSGGKQFKVKEGQTIKLEKIEGKEGTKIKFDTLLTAATDGTDFNLGKPSLGNLVEGELTEQGKDKKVTVVKYKNKTRHKRTLGHRQNYTKVKISKIS
jgi:large subunit ribosomal protein L21